MILTYSKSLILQVVYLTCMYKVIGVVACWRLWHGMLFDDKIGVPVTVVHFKNKNHPL